jgi:hypothetical protein
MGRIYQGAESVIVWLGDISKLAADIIRVTRQITDVPAADSVWNDEKRTSVAPRTGIDARFYNYGIAGAIAVISSQWHVTSYEAL